MTLMSLNDVRDFVEEMRDKLLVLEGNLVDLGYLFSNAEGPIQFATDFDIKAINDLAETNGPLPLLYHEWYRVFRCVDFGQAHTQLESQGNEPLAGLGLNCPLVFVSLSESRALRETLLEHHISVRNEVGKTLAPTGGSASNCEPKGVWLPDESIDPVLYDEGNGQITMMRELVTALESGGFPFWDRMFKRRRFTSPTKNSPDFQRLKPALIRNLR